MSAIVCGKRSFFEELPSLVTKRARCTTSPVRLSPSRSASESFVHPSSPSPLLDHLIGLFPDMDEKLLERALEECGDLDLAIKRLNELRLGCATNDMGTGVEHSDNAIEATEETEVAKVLAGVSSDDQVTPTNMSPDGAQWVELFVKEMISATNMDDARIRAARALEALEKSISARTSAEVAQNFHQENTMLKEQIQALLHENGILKRAVSIQHERQKECDSKVHEVEHLKQLVSQYQEQIRTLEVNNYALSMHLKQAQQSNSIPGRFNPDIF
ncbi:hypothetical protein V2J09_000260 [Rumex salicifolius]